MYCLLLSLYYTEYLALTSILAIILLHCKALQVSIGYRKQHKYCGFPAGKIQTFRPYKNRDKLPLNLVWRRYLLDKKYYPPREKERLLYFSTRGKSICRRNLLCLVQILVSSNLLPGNPSFVLN